MSVYIGIDNGTTGAIGIITPDEVKLVRSRAYTRSSTLMSGKGNEIDPKALAEILAPYSGGIKMATIERPFTAVNMGNAPVLSRGAFESTRAVLELLDIPFQVIDSRRWQKVYLPAGIKGSKDLKAASKALGIQRFPASEPEIRKQGDADALFLAHWGKNNS